MKKRFFFSRESGGVTAFDQLLLTRNQRLVLLKWLTFTALFLLLQVVQDVIFSRVRIFGGCPDVVPAFLLLVCLTQEVSSGALFVMCCCVFRSLCGTVLGSASVAVLVFSAVLLSMLRQNLLWGQVWSVLVCTWLGLLANQAVIFGLGLFLGHTTISRIPAALGGVLTAWAAAAAFYPLVRLVGKIGGNTWKE